MRIYISGAITGHEDTAESRFLSAEKMLSKLYADAELIDPFLIGRQMQEHANTLTHKEYMDICFSLMKLCDCIYFIPGWENSNGCKQERIYAENIGMRVLS